MEMPSGWKSLKTTHIWEPDFANDEVEMALDLIKEMAEALDAVEKRMQVWYDISNLKRIGEPVYQQEYLDIKNLNRKFKEWK